VAEALEGMAGGAGDNQLTHTTLAPLGRTGGPAGAASVAGGYMPPSVSLAEVLDAAVARACSSMPVGNAGSAMQAPGTTAGGTLEAALASSLLRGQAGHEVAPMGSHVTAGACPRPVTGDAGAGIVSHAAGHVRRPGAGLGIRVDAGPLGMLGVPPGSAELDNAGIRPSSITSTHSTGTTGTPQLGPGLEAPARGTAYDGVGGEGCVSWGVAPGANLMERYLPDTPHLPPGAQRPRTKRTSLSGDGGGLLAAVLAHAGGRNGHDGAGAPPDVRHHPHPVVNTSIGFESLMAALRAQEHADEQPPAPSTRPLNAASVLQAAGAPPSAQSDIRQATAEAELLQAARDLLVGPVAAQGADARMSPAPREAGEVAGLVGQAASGEAAAKAAWWPLLR